MDFDIELCSRLYDEATDLRIKWFIKSWDLKGEDKVIALAYYSKADKECKRLINRLCELTKRWEK